MKTLCTFAVLPEADGSPSESRTASVLERSERGLFLASNTLYPPGTSLSLVLDLPGQRLPTRLHGVVAWARTADPAGMFVELHSPADAAAAPERAATASADTAKKPRPEPISS